MTDKPSTTLDLSQPAHALHLAAVAFAAELHERTRGVALAPLFMLSIDPPSQGSAIHYTLLDVLRPGQRITADNPAELLVRFYEPGVWQETRP
jgi:hypothetical protein